MKYEVIVIGGGPAGCSTALYAKSRGKDVVIFEKDKVGGLIGNVSLVSHYLSAIPNENGIEFAKRMKAQLEGANIPVIKEEVEKVEKDGEEFVVSTKENRYMAKKVVVATGSSLKELSNIDSTKVYHWPLGMEDKLKGKTVVVNGGSDGASKEALYISKFAKEVHMVQDQKSLMCIAEFRTQIESSDKIKVHCGATLENIVEKDGVIKEVKLSSGEVIESNEILIFVQIGLNPNMGVVKEMLKLEGGFVPSEVKNSGVEGLYFAGDIRVKDVRQIATAVADGCLAGVLLSK